MQFLLFMLSNYMSSRFWFRVVLSATISTSLVSGFLYGVLSLSMLFIFIYESGPYVAKPKFLRAQFSIFGRTSVALKWTKRRCTPSPGLLRILMTSDNSQNNIFFYLKLMWININIDIEQILVLCFSFGECSYQQHDRGDRCGRYRMVVGLTTTYVISAYHD